MVLTTHAQQLINLVFSKITFIQFIRTVNDLEISSLTWLFVMLRLNYLIPVVTLISDKIL